MNILISMSVKERLKSFISYKEMSVRRFCLKIGVSESFVSSMRVSISPDKLSVISETFPDLNTIWLLTGDGEMINVVEGDKNNMSASTDKLLDALSLSLRSQSELLRINNDLIERISKLEESLSRIEEFLIQK